MYGSSIEGPAETSFADDADGTWDNGVCEFCESALSRGGGCARCAERVALDEARDLIVDYARNHGLWCRYVDGVGWVPCGGPAPEHGVTEDLNAAAIRIQQDSSCRSR